ncbi:unnamed protein product, partial [Discosporangium mesarthrocarpum]
MIKSGHWNGATYSVFRYHTEVGDGMAVVEGVGKHGEGVLVEEDVYPVSPGCYRIQVTAGSDPEALAWFAQDNGSALPSLGAPYSGAGSGDLGSPGAGEGVGVASKTKSFASGAGADGGFLAVGGGVCGLKACEEGCLMELLLGQGAQGALGRGLWEALGQGQGQRQGPEQTGECWGFQTLLSGCGQCPMDLAQTKEACALAGCDPRSDCLLAEEDLPTSTTTYMRVEVLLRLLDEEGGITGNHSNSGLPRAEYTDFKALRSSAVDVVAAWLGAERDEVELISANGISTEGLSILSHTPGSGLGLG